MNSRRDVDITTSRNGNKRLAANFKNRATLRR
jgi:hypothetical protein